MSNDALISAIIKWRKARGMSERAVSVAAGASPDFIRDLRRRSKRAPQADVLMKMERVLGLPMGALLSTIGLSQEGISGANRTGAVRRFTAALYAAYGSPASAAEAMGRDVDYIARIIGGEYPSLLSSDVIMKLAAMTGIPLRWLEGGVMDGMPAAIAARIGLFDPGLVPPIDPEETHADHQEWAES